MKSSWESCKGSLADKILHTQRYNVWRFRPRSPYDLGDWFLRQQAAVDEAYIGLRDIPARWAAITVPDDLAESHDLMLQVIRLKLKVVQNGTQE